MRFILAVIPQAVKAIAEVSMMAKTKQCAAVEKEGMGGHFSMKYAKTNKEIPSVTG